MYHSEAMNFKVIGLFGDCHSYYCVPSFHRVTRDGAEVEEIKMYFEYLTWDSSDEFIGRSVVGRYEGFIVAQMSSRGTCRGGFFPSAYSFNEFCEGDGWSWWRYSLL